jgi:AhpD family alkylhydroperoxidase
MTARINNPASLLPESMTGIQAIIKAAHRSGVPRSTMDLAHLRASQINGCSPCVYSGAISAKKSGESDERLVSVRGIRPGWVAAT